MQYTNLLLDRVREINICLENECYLAALSLALTLPDICGKAAYPQGVGVTKRYIQWYNEYIGKYEDPLDDMPYMSGEIVYNLRNSVLHTGSPTLTLKDIKNERCKVDHFELEIGKTLGGDTSMVEYCGPMEEMRIAERKYRVNIRTFCMKLCRVSEGYYNGNSEKFDFFEYNFVPDYDPDELI